MGIPNPRGSQPSGIPIVGHAQGVKEANSGLQYPSLRLVLALIKVSRGFFPRC
jgi:hypothetical protein